MRLYRYAALIGLGLAVTACSKNTDMYTWGGYDNSLYRYYKSNDRIGEYRDSLVAIIQEATPERPVPPGIYAELGYLEMEAGNREEALRLFELERTTWPESAVFMDRTIQALRGAKQASAAADPSS